MINAKRYRGLGYIALTFVLSLKLGVGWSQPASPNPSTSKPRITKKTDDPTSVLSQKTQKVTDPPPATPKPKGPPPPPPLATVTCTPATVKMGEPVTCVVEAIHPKTMSVQVITPPNTQRNASTPPQPQSDGKLMTRRSFSVRHYDPDRPLRVKNISLTWSALGGHSGIVRLPQQKVKVASVLTGASQPNTRDFRNPLGISNDQDSMALSKPKTQSPKLIEARATFWARHAPPALQEKNWILLVILGVIAVSAFGSLIGWFARRFIESRRKDEGPYIDPRPAHVIALSELGLLAQARLIEAGAHKPYSLRISEIMRAYFGRRYNFAGLEMTSDEVRENLADVDIDDEVLLILDHFLSDTDLIKFADFTTSASALEELAQQAHRMIELSRERALEEESEGAEEESEGSDEEVSSDDRRFQRPEVKERVSDQGSEPTQKERREEGEA